MKLATTVGKGIAWVTLGSVIGKFVVLFNIVAILNHLSVYEYGLSELAFSVISLVSIMLLPGLSSAIVADLGVERANGNQAGMKSLFLQFITLTALLSVVAWALVFFGAPIAAEMVGNPSVGHLLQIASFLFLLSPLRLVSTMLATIELRYADQSFFGVVEEVSKGLLLLFFFFVLGKTLDGLFYATVGAQFIAILLFLPRTLSAYRLMGSRAQDGLAFWKSLHLHRKWSVLTSYGSNLVSAMQLWTVRFFFGTEAVGLFAFASGIVTQLSSLLPLNAVLTPLVTAYTTRMNELTQLLRTSVKLQFWISIALIVGALVFLPLLILLFPKYESAVPIILALLPTIIFSGVATIFTPVFAAFKEQRSLLWSVGLKLGLTALIMPLSLYAFGIIGVGVSAVVVLALSVTERYIRLRPVVPGFSLRFSDLFMLRPHEWAAARALLEHVGFARFLPRKQV